MILILGASGYMGSEFVTECRLRGIDHFPASRSRDLYNIESDCDRLIKMVRPSLVINCAAFIPTPSVDLCKDHKAIAWGENAVFPSELARLCWMHDIPLMHLSTGCLFDERREYTEEDKPTRDLDGYCGFYLQTKLAGEMGVKVYPEHYILRLRLPFDEFYHSRNYLTKLAGFMTVFDHVNSLTHRGDFVKAALDLWELKAPWGTYHVVNPGHVSARQIILRMLTYQMIPQPPMFEPGLAPGCRLSTKKLTDAGVKIRDVHEALDHSIRNWSCIKP